MYRNTQINSSGDLDFFGILVPIFSSIPQNYFILITITHKSFCTSKWVTLHPYYPNKQDEGEKTAFAHDNWSKDNWSVI